MCDERVNGCGAFMVRPNYDCRAAGFVREE